MSNYNKWNNYTLNCDIEAIEEKRRLERNANTIAENEKIAKFNLENPAEKKKPLIEVEEKIAGTREIVRKKTNNEGGTEYYIYDRLDIDKQLEEETEQIMLIRDTVLEQMNNYGCFDLKEIEDKNQIMQEIEMNELTIDGLDINEIENRLQNLKEVYKRIPAEFRNKKFKNFTDFAKNAKGVFKEMFEPKKVETSNKPTYEELELKNQELAQQIATKKENLNNNGTI